MSFIYIRFVYIFLLVEGGLGLDRYCFWIIDIML